MLMAAQFLLQSITRTTNMYITRHHHKHLQQNDLSSNEAEDGNEINEQDNENLDYCNSNESDNVTGSDYIDNYDNDDDPNREEAIIILNQHHQQAAKIDLQRECAAFILKVKDKNNLSQNALESIIESTKYLSDQLLSAVREKFLQLVESRNLDEKELLQPFDEKTILFDGLETESLQSSYIKNNFVYVDYRVIPIGNTLAMRKVNGKRRLVDIEETFIYIPIIDSLKQLLSNRRIRRLVLQKPNLNNDGIFYDLFDGSIYREDAYFKEHEKALILILYHDELEVCNPLGSKAGKHKIDMYYYTIANLSPKYRSKHCSVRLMAIAKANLVKKHGIDTILQPIVEDLIKLYNGVKFEFNDETLEVFGKSLIGTGDTLGQNLWGGFKEGVGAAVMKCRHCYCDFDNMQCKYHSSSFIPRTKETYERESMAIISSNEAVRNQLSTLYGLTHKSILKTIPGFDVTTQLPQDIMHIIAEGVLQYEVRLILDRYQKSNVFTLLQLNARIENHEYGYSEVSSKPGPLRESVFKTEQHKLKNNAAQAKLFLKLLPFYIAPLVDMNDTMYSFLADLIKIIHIIYSPVINVNTVERLRLLINRHLAQFKQEFPDRNIIPKQHFLIHIPDEILKLGPPVRYSCYSFEAAHKYFKAIAQKQNFKNLCLSIAKRYQRVACVDFDGNNDDSHPLFRNEKQFGVLKTVKNNDVEHLRQLFDAFSLLPGITFEPAYEASWVNIHGTRYCKNAIVLICVNKDPLSPVFGHIKRIWVIHGYVYFQVSVLETLRFDENLQSYEIAPYVPEQISVCPYERMVDYNIYHVKELDESTYIPLKYYIHDILLEYSKGHNILFD